MQLRISRLKMPALFFMLIAMTLGGCAHGRTSLFPKDRISGPSSQIVVMRNKNILGSGLRVTLRLDGELIARLKTGDYVQFSVEPKVHSLNANEASVAFQFEEGKKYYFLITPEFGRFEMDRISDGDAVQLLPKFNELR